jgi:hypothetical protein
VQQDANEKWAVLKEWTGGPGPVHKLDPFARPTGPWRISYKTDAGETRTTGVVDVIVRTKQDRMVTAAYNLQSVVAGHLTVREEHPEYYIEVRSQGPSWRVAVEQIDGAG